LPLLLTGALLSALPILLHWGLWRIHLPHRQTRAIVLLTLVTDGVSLLFLAWCQGTLSGATGAPPPLVYLHIALFMFALLCAYIITYSALEADSPTLIMVKMLHDARPEGLEKERFLGMLNDEMLVLPRVRDLERDRMAEVVDGRYVLTPKGRLMARGFNLYARVLGIGLGG
jgi:hypothetical protein